MDAPRFEPADAGYAARVRASFARQPAMATIGASLTAVEPGRVVIELAWQQALTQQHGFLHAGVISTASGLVFFGENSGSFMAADAASGKVLWEFPTNHVWKASPMTYMFDNKQHIAIADICAAVERYCDLGTLCGCLPKAALLCLPLVHPQQVYVGGS